MNYQTLLVQGRFPSLLNCDAFTLILLNHNHHIVAIEEIINIDIELFEFPAKITTITNDDQALLFWLSELLLQILKGKAASM